MPDLSDRYGRAKMDTVQRDFDALRQAIRAHDAEATEAAWEKCERWIGFWPREGLAMRRCKPSKSTEA